MRTADGPRRLALPAVEMHRLRSALLNHYRIEPGRYPNMIRQDLRPRWRPIERRYSPNGLLGAVDYGELAAVADEQAWPEEDEGQPHDHDLAVYLRCLRDAVQRLGLRWRGEPAGWALTAVHADVCGVPEAYATFYNREESTLRVEVSPAYAQLTASDANGEVIVQQEIEPREPFAFDEWNVLTTAAHEMLDAELARLRTGFGDQARYPRRNRANRTFSPSTIALLYRHLRHRETLDKRTADLTRKLAKAIELDFRLP